MAARRRTNWLLSNLPKAVYIALTLGGVIFIWAAKTYGLSNQVAIGVPALLIVTYFLLSAFLASVRIHDEQAGDNLYYMGFLFTLTSLGVSLYRYNVTEPIEAIVRDFGLAVVTTICGIGFRILYQQVRRDPIDIERTARHELAEMTRRVRAELEAASQEFANFRRVSNQMLEEGFEEVGRQAERSGQQIVRSLEALTLEALKPIREAGEQITSVFEEGGARLEARFQNAAERMDSSTTVIEGANRRVTDALASFSDHAEAAGAKLAEVKTPDEIITLRLRPTLKTLEKLLAAQTESLQAAQGGQSQQIEALRLTQSSIERVVGVVERSVEVAGHALESIEHSQQATESLGRQIEQHYAELRRYIDRPAPVIQRPPIDLARTSGVSVAPPSPAPPTPASETDGQTPRADVNAERLRGDDRRFGRWFSRR